MSLLRHECRKLVRTVAILCLVFAHKCWFVQHLSTRLYSLVQHDLVWCSAEPAKPLLGSHHSSRKFSLNWTSVLRSSAQRGATTKSAGPASSLPPSPPCMIIELCLWGWLKIVLLLGTSVLRLWAFSFPLFVFQSFCLLFSLLVYFVFLTVILALCRLPFRSKSYWHVFAGWMFSWCVYC